MDWCNMVFDEKEESIYFFLTIQTGLCLGSEMVYTLFHLTYLFREEVYHVM